MDFPDVSTVDDDEVPVVVLSTVTGTPINDTLSKGRAFLSLSRKTNTNAIAAHSSVTVNTRRTGKEFIIFFSVFFF